MPETRTIETHTPSAPLQAVGITTQAELQACTYEMFRGFSIGWEQLTDDDRNAIALGRSGQNYLSVTLPLRRDAYARAVERMTVPKWLEAFVATMEQRFGPVGQAHANQLPWMQVFMVASYGEEPAYWPDGTEKSFQNGDPVPLELTDTDRKRAMGWMSGARAWPNGIAPVEGA